MIVHRVICAMELSYYFLLFHLPKGALPIFLSSLALKTESFACSIFIFHDTIIFFTFESYFQFDHQ